MGGVGGCGGRLCSGVGGGSLLLLLLFLGFLDGCVDRTSEFVSVGGFGFFCFRFGTRGICFVSFVGDGTGDCGRHRLHTTFLLLNLFLLLVSIVSLDFTILLLLLLADDLDSDTARTSVSFVRFAGACRRLACGGGWRGRDAEDAVETERERYAANEVTQSHLIRKR